MTPCHPFRPVPGQCGPNRRGPLPAPPFDPRDYWATRKLVSSLSGALGKKLDRADVVDPGAAAEAGQAADAKSTYEELNRTFAKLAEKADKATTLAGYGITDAATKAELADKADLVGGKVPAAQLPSCADDVLEYDTVSAFPATGESGKIYVAKDTNLVYRWSGTQYVEISPSPVLDDTVTEESPNGVKSSGIWSAIWGTLSALPAGFTSIYDWCAAKIKAIEESLSGLDKSKLDAGKGLNFAPSKYSEGNAVEIVNGWWLAVIGGFGKIWDVTSDGRMRRSLSSALNGKADKATTLAGYGITDAVPFVEDSEGFKTAVRIGARVGTAGPYSLSNGELAHAIGKSSHAEGMDTIAFAPCSYAGGVMVQTLEEHPFSYVWNGVETMPAPYDSHGKGTFNINPVGGLSGFYIGDQTLLSIMSDKADKSSPSAAGNLAALTADGDLADSGKTVGDFLPRVSDGPVRSTFDISGPLFLDMDGYIQLNRAGFIYGSFNNIREAGDSPISLRTELDSKVGSFEPVGGATVTVENGVAKLYAFFTKSNGLLTGTIDDRLPIPISEKSEGFTTESYKRFIVTVSGDMAVTLHTPTSGDAEIFECRFNGASLSADASITFAGATATTMDANCGTVTAGKVALMSAFWNGTTWDVNWKVEV